MGPRKISHDINAVRAVVDQHTTAGNLGVAVPAIGHVHSAGEGVFEQNHFAQDAAGDNALGSNHIVDVTEF